MTTARGLTGALLLATMCAVAGADEMKTLVTAGPVLNMMVSVTVRPAPTVARVACAPVAEV